VAVPKNTIAVPKRKKIGAETAKIKSAEKSAETGGNQHEQRPSSSMTYPLC
jgi:hypothetical protein